MFNWKLLHDDVLIEEFFDIDFKDNIYYVNDNLFFDSANNLLYRNNDDYEIKLDFDKEDIYIRIKEKNVSGNLKLNKTSITNNESDLIVEYQVDETEPINKIIISRKD